MSSIYDLEFRSCRRRLAHRGHPEGQPPPWTRALALEALRSEVEGLEGELLGVEAEARRAPERVRSALEWLRLYGRRLTRAQTALEHPDREQWTERLRLEHRWCYAAAGTTRADFDEATGRMGAR